MITTQQVLDAYSIVFLGTKTPSTNEISYWVNSELVTATNLAHQVAAYTLLHQATTQEINYAKAYLYYQTSEEVIRPLANWEGGVTERIVFNTDILTARYGTEQRLKLLQKPKVTVEFGILLHRQGLQHFQNQITRAQGSSVWFPLWFGAIQLTNADLNDLANVEGVAVGKYMLYAGYKYFELIDFVSVLGNLQLQHPVVGTYNYGAWLVPVARGSVNDKINLSFISSQVATGQISSNLEPFEVPHNTKTLVMLEDMPVFPIEQNWVSPTQTDITRPVQILDYGTGITAIYDLHGFSNVAKTAEFIGRRKQYGVRDFFLDCAGRFKTFYCPTFVEDITLTEDFEYTIGLKHFTMKEAGLYDYYYANSSNKYIYVEFYSRPAIICRIGMPSGDTLPVFSTIGNTDAFGFGFKAKEVRRISFMPCCRFNSDTLEINWITPEVYKATATIITVK